MQKRHDRNRSSSEKFRIAKQREYSDLEKMSRSERAYGMFKHKPYTNDMRRGADDE